jgi:hypothetical protein
MFLLIEQRWADGVSLSARVAARGSPIWMTATIREHSRHPIRAPQNAGASFHDPYVQI